jgi:hypothetical protein
MQTKTTTHIIDMNNYIEILEDAYDLFSKEPPLQINYYKQMTNNKDLYYSEIKSLSKYLEIDSPKHTIINNKKYLEFFCAPKVDFNLSQQRYWSAKILLELPEDSIEIFTTIKPAEYKSHLFVCAVKVDVYKEL